jgi:integrase
VKQRAVGVKLHILVGEQTQVVVPTKRSSFVRLSLRTDDPAEVKRRTAEMDGYLENVWRALRADAPASLSHKQATALAGDLYHSWANGEEQEQRFAIEHDPDFLYPDDHIPIRAADGKRIPSAWRRVGTGHVPSEEWAAAEALLDRLKAADDVTELEKHFGALLDRLLLSKGILRIDEASREMVLRAVWQALKDAFAQRRRNAEGDYSPDPKAGRFPAWTAEKVNRTATRNTVRVSLKEVVESWWKEAKARGLKPSTHESYRNTMATFVRYLGHDDASRVTRDDVIGFKNHRLATIDPRSRQPISAKTIKDSDLAGLKTVFGWAQTNGKMATNPAEGVTIRLGKKLKLRSKGFTDEEAESILVAARTLVRGKEKLKTFSAKRWVPWLCAYTGARVGELAQIRKKDVCKEGSHWILTITPEAGTVKTNEARRVVLHEHLIELGFVEFVNGATPGHLFLDVCESGEVTGRLQGVKNRIAEFVRTVVRDKNVAPNHAWRHRFKTGGIEAGIEHRILDAIQGHRPRNVAEGYGEVSTKAQAAAIAKMPRYLVTP